MLKDRGHSFTKKLEMRRTIYFNNNNKSNVKNTLTCSEIVLEKKKFFH